MGCDGQCVLYPYSAVTSLGLGGDTCGWVCRPVLLFDFREVSRMSMVVWDSTGSICKVNGYLSRKGFLRLDDYGRFSAVVQLRSFLDLANLFWLKVLLVPVGV